MKLSQELRVHDHIWTDAGWQEITEVMVCPPVRDHQGGVRVTCAYDVRPVRSGKVIGTISRNTVHTYRWNQHVATPKVAG